MAQIKNLSDKEITNNKTNSIMQTIEKRDEFYSDNVNRLVED